MSQNQHTLLGELISDVTKVLVAIEDGALSPDEVKDIMSYWVEEGSDEGYRATETIMSQTPERQIAFVILSGMPVDLLAQSLKDRHVPGDEYPDD